MKILVVGKLSKNKEEVKSIVEDLGGKMTTTANKATLCISTQSEQPCLGYWWLWFRAEQITEDTCPQSCLGISVWIRGSVLCAHMA